MFIALLGWLVAILALVSCWKLGKKLLALGGPKRVRTVGVQTTTTFRRRFAAPRMAELADGEHGTWVD